MITQIKRNYTDKNLTPFQKKVYKAVSEIPKGEVRTYKWVARRIGNPRASRAVGQALKRNPYTVIIPCHRVIRSDGSLGGYSKGTRIKKRLLKRESYGTGHKSFARPAPLATSWLGYRARASAH